MPVMTPSIQLLQKASGGVASPELPEGVVQQVCSIGVQLWPG